MIKSLDFGDNKYGLDACRYLAKNILPFTTSLEMLSLNEIFSDPENVALNTSDYQKLEFIKKDY